MRILLSKGNGLIPCLIKFQTRSIYSHAAIVFDDDTLIEATWPKVRRKSWLPMDGNYDLFHVETTPEQDKIIREFCEAQLGKAYDLTMVARFITRRQESRSSSGKWFCSELVAAAFAKALIYLLERIEPWAMSPALISYSPLLKLVPKPGPKLTTTSKP